MSLFRNTFRIETTRLQGHDYSAQGLYFVTVCTYGMVNYFGDIQDYDMILNEYGRIIAEEWQQTAKIRSNVELDEWIIMPNHVHGIINITESGVETHSNAQTSPQKFGPQRRNLASIIRGFKGSTTKRLHLIGCIDFAWQSRYYDHIIRNEKSLNNIQTYIRNNPAQWEIEKNDPEKFHQKYLRNIAST